MEVLVNERKIWWIASYPKSGNTWVRMFMNAYISGFPIDINSGFQYTVGDNHPQYFQSVYCRPYDQLTATEQACLRPAVLMTALSMSAAKHVCLKTHHAKVQVDDIPLFPPKVSAGGVYLTRDPRDLVLSYSDHLGETIDSTIESMNEMSYVNIHRHTKLMHVLTTWSMHVTSWTEKNKNIPVKIIRYEDMVRNPEQTFVKVLEGLGFPDVDQKRFDFAIEQTQFSNLQKLEAENGFKELGQGEKFFRIGKVGQWLDKLTHEQIKRIENDHGEIMEKHGYKLSTKKPATSNHIYNPKTKLRGKKRQKQLR
jgi:hypothetical protein